MNNFKNSFQKYDGMNYAPVGEEKHVVKPGEFVIAATALEHGHVYGQCNALLEAGATLKWVYDPHPEKVESFLERYPGVKAARTYDEILDDPEVRLVTAAAVPCERAAIGFRAMRAGKDYFTDKSPFTTLDQLAEARKVAAATKQKYMVYYSERLHSQCAMLAGHIIEDGAIGRVIQVIGMGPHRIGIPSNRPEWFFQKEKYGGILCDIGSHQCEQFLHYTGATDATVTNARVDNFNHPEFPELEDFGDANMVADNGASFYFRCDWFTPDGLRTWGDGRTFILGTEGYIELRKYVDIATERMGEQILLVNGEGEKRIDANGKIGFPFFGDLILDCLNRTENAMTQDHAFKAAELSLKAQAFADAVR